MNSPGILEGTDDETFFVGMSSAFYAAGIVLVLYVLAIHSLGIHKDFSGRKVMWIKVKVFLLFLASALMLAYSIREFVKTGRGAEAGRERAIAAYIGVVAVLSNFFLIYNLPKTSGSDKFSVAGMIAVIFGSASALFVGYESFQSGRVGVESAALWGAVKENEPPVQVCQDAAKPTWYGGECREACPSGQEWSRVFDADNHVRNALWIYYDSPERTYFLEKFAGMFPDVRFTQILRIKPDPGSFAIVLVEYSDGSALKYGLLKFAVGDNMYKYSNEHWGLSFDKLKLILANDEYYSKDRVDAAKEAYPAQFYKVKNVSCLPVCLPAQKRNALSGVCEAGGNANTGLFGSGAGSGAGNLTGSGSGNTSANTTSNGGCPSGREMTGVFDIDNHVQNDLWLFYDSPERTQFLEKFASVFTGLRFTRIVRIKVSAGSQSRIMVEYTTRTSPQTWGIVIYSIGGDMSKDSDYWDMGSDRINEILGNDEYYTKARADGVKETDPGQFYNLKSISCLPVCLPTQKRNIFSGDCGSGGNAVSGNVANVGSVAPTGMVVVSANAPGPVTLTPEGAMVAPAILSDAAQFDCDTFNWVETMGSRLLLQQYGARPFTTFAHSSQADGTCQFLLGVEYASTSHPMSGEYALEWVFVKPGSPIRTSVMDREHAPAIDCVHLLGLESDLKDSVYADPVDLRQSFMHLLWKTLMAKMTGGKPVLGAVEAFKVNDHACDLKFKVYNSGNVAEYLWARYSFDSNTLSPTAEIQ